MKELHNHIFSNTTCISKETMLRYINKQLSKNELYEVEKHMLDCELCTDAYEGMAYAQNASILFAIDSRIDQRVGGGNFKTPVMRNLMVAASILVIVFGAYFTFNYFNTTLNNESGLAINEVDESKQDEVPMEEKLLMEEVDEDNQQVLASKNGELIDILEDDEEQDDKNRTAVVDVPDAVVSEQAPKANGAFGYVMEGESEISEAEEEVTVAANIARKRASKAKGEKEKQLESLRDANKKDADNRREDDFVSAIQSESTVSNELPNISTNEPVTDKSGEALKNVAEKPIRNARKNEGKKRFKSVSQKKAQTPEFNSSGKLEESSDVEDRKQQKTIVIDSYKVVDYTEEYQAAYDLKNANTIKTKSVSAGFESKDDKEEEAEEKDKITVEVTYKETLDKAIKLYKNKKYVLAIEQFDVILAEHPEEVNGLFYQGLSNYYLQRYGEANGKLDKVLKNKETSFNEEAKWYKALTLIALNKKEEAKSLLQGIIKSKGFYKTKAEEQLKRL